MKMSVYPYKRASKSAKLLYQKLQQVSLIPIKYTWSRTKVRVNWGSTRPLAEYNKVVLNHPKYLTNTINKIKFYKKCRELGLPVPSFTTSFEEAKELHNNYPNGTVERHLVNSSKGRGIKIIKKGETLNSTAKIWVERVRQRREFRFVVVGNKVVVSMVKKRPRNIEPQPIQNEGSGYKYFLTRENEENLYPLQEGHQISIKLVKEFGLDFGAVDMYWDKRKEVWGIFEVNTAFGLGENNADAVAKAIHNLVLKKLKIV